MKFAAAELFRYISTMSPNQLQWSGFSAQRNRRGNKAKPVGRIDEIVAESDFISIIRYKYVPMGPAVFAGQKLNLSSIWGPKTVAAQLLISPWLASVNPVSFHLLIHPACAVIYIQMNKKNLTQPSLRLKPPRSIRFYL